MDNVNQTTDPVVLIQLGRMNGKSAEVAEYIDSKLNPKVFCKFCGRELKNTKSKQNGYGQGCYTRWVRSRRHKRNLI